MSSTRRWPIVYVVVGLVLLAALGALIAAVPTKDGATDWFGPMIPGGWMAWTLPIALFFYAIASLLIIFTVLAIRFPEIPRVGVLRIETTRGDRLFISLLGSAFLCIGWLALFGAPLWGALILCLVYAVAVFRWV
ncbi:DUF2160 domain-containing protein [Segnochrobactrum spirostomi]|uniref:Glycerol-3-phosphate ABC transporter n=1 Tax=Segnochrobactrum spirostomi TaxID=2608987 RepID=A0A6A7Y2A7_9HYPH|nr:DUF2160 domain-containing protein [Segnochrobactrum spirostomi]MQT13180.1 glycerol-3-phosphate ABC transporter [Segnochrobactrum spirostomi]